ncbi:hypothetical protein B0T25DRAFT_568046 [Lasiosphaeria hispida]|uniref:Uncharacterized protein n=1 Tax=Lasiosphaeria hispida TaxID=260671 RepID=A0AAJ0HHY9_9PEZI|nr:hypothetical protein B0T25DRAFT_568046 [Lasiosphaeria hispida]
MPLFFGFAAFLCRCLTIHWPPRRFKARPSLEQPKEQDHPEVVLAARSELVALFSRALVFGRTSAEGGILPPGDEYALEALRKALENQQDQVFMSWEQYVRGRKTGLPRRLFGDRTAAVRWLIQKAPLKLHVEGPARAKQADVFLDQRQTNNVKHNALVSVVLETNDVGSVPPDFRILPRYLIFLTTNRVDCFDLAFKSRIHLAIKYPKLEPSSRRKLWHTFLLQISKPSAEALAADGTLDELAEEQLNGRQIKNVVRTAYTLALSENAPIRKDHIISAVGPMKLFEMEMEKTATEKRKRDALRDRELTVSAKRPRIGGDVTTLT